MAITENRPMRRVGVGALYHCFINEQTYDPNVKKSNIVKNIGTTENRTSDMVYASNQPYEQDVINNPAQMAVEVIAFHPGDVAKMKGNKVQGAWVIHGNKNESAYFALGVVYPKRNGQWNFVWYPKCVMVEMTDEAQTIEENSTNAQNRTITIQAMTFNDAGDWKVEYDTELLGEGETAITEEAFFEKPLTEPLQSTAPEIPEG